MTEEHKELINLAINVSSAALINFFQKINLDFTKLTEVNTLNLKFGQTIGVAKYDAKTELITLNPIEIYSILRNYDQAEKQEKKSVKTNVILEIATNIIHEKIHALRTIPIPKDSVNLPYLMHIPDQLVKKEIARFKGQKYELKLDEYIETKAVSCDILHGVNTLTDLTEFTSLKDMDEDTLYRYLINTIISKRILECQKQEALEECITEALTQIIIYNFIPKNKDLSIDKLADKVIKKSTDREDALMGAKIIKEHDNIIPWFLTTRFNLEYKDLFPEIFKEDYNTLLDSINHIYTDFCNKDFAKQTDIKTVNEILEKINTHSKTI